MEKAPVHPWGARKTTGEPGTEQGVASGMGRETTLAWTGWHPRLGGTVAGKTCPDEKKKIPVILHAASFCTTS